MHIEDNILASVTNDTIRTPLQTAIISDTSKKDDTVGSAPLRSIKIDQPFYNSNDIKDRSIAEDIESKLNSGQSGKEIKERMALAAASMTKQDFSDMKENGFSPMDMDDEEMVTIADKIRMQLAKAGVDVSMMGGLSDSEIEAMSGSTVGAVAMENSVAAQKASEITGISDEAKRYLVTNSLEPTIENIYQATYSVSAKYDIPQSESNITEEQLNILGDQIQRVITDAGIEINDKTVSEAKCMVSEGIPLTSDTFSYYHNLSTKELELSPEEIENRINEAVKEGKSPQQAYLLPGYSVTDRAKNALNIIENATDRQIESLVENGLDITIDNISKVSTGIYSEANPKDSIESLSARRSLEETRLLMSVEANYSLIRKGIAIDTTSLNELVEELKMQENLFYQKVLEDDKTQMTLEENIEIYESSNKAVSELKLMPAATLGVIIGDDRISLRRLHEKGNQLTAKLAQVGERYETMRTEIRKDLGDSIKKAFGNVDDILEDLNIPLDDKNRRAVRILGYNSLPITNENIEKMKGADQELQRVFKGLTPGVVAKMVKAGENPLDMSLAELNASIEKHSKDGDNKYSAEEYAKFLWKAERSNELTPEERESFIGIYRLMHQVTQSDGAVIGRLLNQGVDITMRNLMTAIRSAKHENREAVIDDSFGFVSDFKKKDLSITQQIEMVFQTSRMKDAKEAVTPAKLANLGGEESIMPMTPDELATALENESNENIIDKEFESMQLENLQKAVESEEKIYSVLKQYDIPVSPANLEAMQSFYQNRNGMYKNLFDRKVFSQTLDDVDFDNINLDEIMADIIHDFGEAVKTPSDMAKAQQKLEEIAVNVMKSMMVERRVGSFEVNGMRVAMTQIQMMGRISKDTENYTIPIMVADEQGTMSLKIVRGADNEKGLVDIAFEMENTGVVNASIRYEAERIRGTVSCSNAATRDILESNKQLLEEKIGLQSPKGVSLTFTNSSNIRVADTLGSVSTEFETTTEQAPIQTSVLYGMAKGFIDSLGEIFG